MASPKELPPPRGHGPRRQWFYVLTAALTCPCHLPIYLLILGGTSMGAALRDNLGLAFLGLTLAFVLALSRGIRRPLGDGSRDKDMALPPTGGRDPAD